MGNWGLVTFYYDYEKPSVLGSERCRGFISKAYKHAELYHILMHAYNGAAYFWKHRNEKHFYADQEGRTTLNHDYEHLNTAFDVFFEDLEIASGFDNVKSVLEDAADSSDPVPSKDLLYRELFSAPDATNYLHLWYTGNPEDGYRLKYRSSCFQWNKEKEDEDVFDINYNDYTKTGEESDSLKNALQFIRENALHCDNKDEYSEMTDRAIDLIREILQPTELTPVSDDEKIDSLGFSVRTYNCLKRNGIHTIEELKALSDEELRSVRNLGSPGYEEIKAVLTKQE